MEEIFRLEEKYKKDLKNIEKVEESLDSMRIDARRKTDSMIDELLYHSKSQSTTELYPIIHQMNANVEEFDLYLRKCFNQLNDEREEVATKYRKEMEQLEEEYIKKKRAENL